jgi:molybdopterin molybdotransferase
MKDWQEVSWDHAREAASTAVSPLLHELLPLPHCLDRRVAEIYPALCDLPPYTTSAMDGYAVSGQGPWRIIGDVKAGTPHKDVLKSGTAVRIATGAVIPLGTFGVVRWEFTKVKDNYIYAEANEGAEIRAAGEESRKGDLLVRRGTKLSPSHLGLLASTGYDQIKVFRKPRIAILLLGDELQLAGIPVNGLVRDSLGPQLPGWLARLGAEVVSLTYVTDELESVVRAISETSPLCDLIVTTGGTADGPRDHVHAALEKIGASFVVDRVRSRPGHPALLAMTNLHSRIPLIGLPGNPQSAVVGLMTLGAPLLGAFQGEGLPELSEVVTGEELKAPENFTRLVLGNLVDGTFEMGKHLGSAMLRGLVDASGFALVQSGITPVGGKVKWLPLP